MLRNKFLLLFAAIALVGGALWLQVPSSTPRHADARAPALDRTASPQPQSRRSAYPDFLPAQAHAVLRRIANGDPHPYRQDGATFQNREGRLPRQPRGYYREYTVDTPGLDHRGARRIVTGGQPPAIYYYTDDHYGSFRDFQLPQGWQDHE